MLWGNRGVENLGEVFRNQSVFKTEIMGKGDFEKFILKFKSEEDPITKQPIDLEFNST